MAAFIGILLAKFLSPDVAIIAILTGIFANNWIHICVGIIIAAVANEGLLMATQVTRAFEPVIFLIALIAAGIWATPIFLFRKR